MNKLLQACKRGDRLAQKELYEKYKGKMYILCLRYSNSREDARDVMQEGFVKVFRDLHQYKGTGNFEGWVRKVILNVALSHLRKQKKRFQIVDVDNLENRAGVEEEFVIEENIQEGLIALMHKLPVGFRTVLNLYVLEGFTHPEIAQQLGISVGTSKSQLNRAKKYMRTLLEEELTKHPNRHQELNIKKFRRAT